MRAAEETVLGRSLAGLASTSGEGEEAIRFFFPARYEEPFVTVRRGQRVALRALGARRSPLKIKDGAVVYERPYPSTDIFHRVTDGRSEEFLRLREIRFLGDDPRSSLRIERPYVIDGTGRRSEAASRWELRINGKRIGSPNSVHCIRDFSS